MLGLIPAWLSTTATGLILCLALVALSQLVLRSAGEPFSVLGLSLERSRRHEFVVGFAIGLTLFLGVAGAQSVMVGARWEFTGSAGLLVAASAFGVTIVLVLVEELMFRGVALRQLRCIFGDRAAILLSAVLFGVYHLIQSDNWGMGAAFSFLMPCLGGVLFGIAAVQSRGLALPLGLHLGGNWVQAALTGFAPVGTGATDAVWRIPVSATDIRTLTAPDALPRLPYMAGVALATFAVWALTRSHRGGARTT
jgi:membrane protease YdiL (CAAX protease family)